MLNTAEPKLIMFKRGEAPAMKRQKGIVTGQRLSIIIALAIGALIATAPIVGARYPIPTYNAAVVDGDISEWNLEEDYFAPMYISSDSSKTIASNAYTRYDRNTRTVYVLVLEAEGFDVQSTWQHAWGNILKFDTGKDEWVEDYKLFNGKSGNDGTPPDFAWVGLNAVTERADGYEASFTLTPGTYNVGFHVNVHDLSRGSRIENAGTTSLLGNVILHLETGAQIDVIKSVSTDGTTWDDANTAPGLTTIAGTTIYYKFEVINTGIYPLDTISLFDNPPVTFTTTPPTTLEVGESFTVYTDAVAAEQGYWADIASVSARANTPFGRVQVVDSDPANYTATVYVVPEPAFALAMLSILAVAGAFIVYKKTRP
jgi:hypothetical protein